MNVQMQARKRWDSIAKPLHSLGLLEDLVVKIAGIQETADVCIERRGVLVFCGDHGVVRKGVSQTNEVGAGVVPMAAEDRAFREAVGRVLCVFARNAEQVTRCVCGIGVRLK